MRECACASASDEEVEKSLGPAGGGVGSEQGGKGGQEVILIHHSRNTQSKQWDSTWETALQGVVRISQPLTPQPSTLNTKS